jgi:hypothetical protein
MSLFHKVVGRGAVQFARAGRTVSAKVPAVSFAQRSFSSILESRELGEETRYIRSIEAQRKAEIRANIERILALEDGHVEKAGLEQLLGIFSIPADANIKFSQFLTSLPVCISIYL